MKQERLDKFISSQTALSRSEVKTLVKNGSVRVNGAVCALSDKKIDPNADEVSVSGRVIRYKPFVYYMLNKPAGVVTATEDKREKTVLDLVPEEMRRPSLFPAGRLDKDTVGLLIITDDGDFAHRMLSPKKHVKKYYEAVLDRVPGEELEKRFSEGVVLEDGTLCKPAEVISVEGTTVNVALTEGKFHQVKRMFKALGCTVLSLERKAIGALVLDSSLKRGEIRELGEDEKEKVFEI